MGTSGTSSALGHSLLQTSLDGQASGGQGRCPSALPTRVPLDPVDFDNPRGIDRDCLAPRSPELRRQNLRVFPCAPRKKTPSSPPTLAAIRHHQPRPDHSSTLPAPRPTSPSPWAPTPPSPDHWILDLDADSDEAVDLVVETLFQGIDLHTPVQSANAAATSSSAGPTSSPTTPAPNWKIHSADGTRGLIDVKAGNGKGSYCIFPVNPPRRPHLRLAPRTLPRRLLPCRSRPKSSSGSATTSASPPPPRTRGKPTTPNRPQSPPPRYWQDLLEGLRRGAATTPPSASPASGWSEIDITNPQALEEQHREFLHWNERNSPPLAPIVVEATWHNAPRPRNPQPPAAKQPDRPGPVRDLRAVRVNADPPKRKLFGPLWEGFVELSLDQWLNVAARRETAARGRRGVGFDYGFGSLWSGNRKERRGLRRSWPMRRRRRSRAFEECRDRVVAHLIWSQHLDHALSAEEPHARSAPCRLADGSLWFKTEYLLTNGGSLKDYPERNEINAVLRGVRRE